MAVEKNTYLARLLRFIAVTESGMGSKELSSRKDPGNRALSGVRIVYCDVAVNVF